MGLISRLKALNQEAPVARLINYIARVCPIPPSPWVRALPTMRLLASATAVTLLLAGLMAALLPPPPGPDLWVISKDSVLPPKRPSEWPPDPEGRSFGGGFFMTGNEKLVIRDCTIYTSIAYVPPSLKVPYDNYAAGINLEDFSNLTMINVKVVPSIDIQIHDNAFLKMVNVTNWSTGWHGHGSDNNPPKPGVYSMGYGGGITVYGNATVWVENSRIASVTRSFFSTNPRITVINSWFASSRKYTAVKVNATLSKTEFKWGEPISVDFSLENVGDATLNFSSPDIDRFNIIAYEYTDQPKNNSILYNYEPGLPEFRFPPQLGPGEAIAQKLTLLGDGSTPFSIKRRLIQGEDDRFVWTDEWWNTSLPSGKYWISGNIHSRSLELAVNCGRYVVTISEEK